MWEDGPLLPALIATLSSPVKIKLRVMVTLVAFIVSMPSAFRAVLGVLIMTPHAVNPFPLEKTTWKFGEFFSVMRYNVKLSDPVITRRRGQFWLAFLTLASCARSHHDSFLPISDAQPRPSMTPSPITPASGTRSTAISGLQPPPFLSTMPQLPGETS